MTVFTKRAVTIFAATDAFGAMRSVINGEVQTWGAEVETAINAAIAAGALVYATKADLDADLAHDANTGAWVVADSIDANNGIYAKSGASGSGSWTKVDDLPAGDDGWSPLFHILADGARRIIEIHDWTGGAGSKPQTGYLGATGIVADIAQATDVRGPQGASGDGSGDLVSTNNLSDLSSADTALINLGGGTSGIAVLKAEDTAALTTALAGAVDDAAVKSPSIINNRKVDFPSVTDYWTDVTGGVVGDGQDDYGAFLAAFSQSKTGIVRVPSGTFLLGTPLVLDKMGQGLIGRGAGQTIIKATHSDGPVIHWQSDQHTFRGLTIDASTGRKNGAAGANFGMMQEAPDIAGKTAQFSIVENIDIRNQPSCGIVYIGFGAGSWLRSFHINNNGGDAIRVDNGTIVGRTNKVFGGEIIIYGGDCKDNAGHGVRAGGDGEDNNVCFRLDIHNVDFVRNATSAGFRKDAYNLWMMADDSSITNCGIGGFSGTGSPPLGDANAVTGALAVAGRNVTVQARRLVNVKSPAYKVLNFPSELISENIHFLGARVIDSSSSPGEQVDLDPLVSVQAGARDIIVSGRYRNRVKTLLKMEDGTGVPGGVVNGAETVYKITSQSVTNSTTLVNDDDLSFPIDAYEKLSFEARIHHIGNSAADFKCTFTGPSGCTIRFVSPSGIRYDIGDTISIDSITSEGSTKTFGGSTSVRALSITGWVENGATAGTIQFQWAQNAATAVDTQVLGGATGASNIIVTRAQ